VAERAAWRAEITAGHLTPEQLIFVDESGIDTRMTRRYARAPRGQRAYGAVPWGHWQRLTLIGALGPEGLVAMMSIAATTTTVVFRAFVERVLIPALRQRGSGMIVAFDHLPAHKAAVIHDALQTAGCQARLLPRYSSDFNPIEHAWSKIKTALRAIGARSLDELDRELPAVLDSVTPEDAHGWFKHCGYALN
jgi:transposase